MYKIEQSSDYQLVMECKCNNSQQAQMELFTKYMPLINKYVYRHPYSDDFQDRKHEAFEALIAAVKYCNDDKIYDKENFSIITFLSWELSKKFQKQKQVEECILEEDTVYNDIIFEKIETNIRFEDLKKECSETENKILEMLMNNHLKVEIAKECGISNSNLSHIIKKLMRKYKDHFDIRI